METECKTYERCCVEKHHRLASSEILTRHRTHLLINIRNIRPICLLTNHRDAIRILVPDTFGFRFALVYNWNDNKCECMHASQVFSVLIRGCKSKREKTRTVTTTSSSQWHAGHDLIKEQQSTWIDQKSILTNMNL